jgi:hypothetical protein
MCASFRKRNDRVIIKDTRASASKKHIELLEFFKSEIQKYNTKLILLQREYRIMNARGDRIEMSKKEFEITQMRNKLLSIEHERDEYLFSVNMSPKIKSLHGGSGTDGECSESEISSLKSSSLRDNVSIATRIARPELPIQLSERKNTASTLMQMPTIAEFNNFYAALEEIPRIKSETESSTTVPISESISSTKTIFSPETNDGESIVDEYLQHATPELSKLVERSPKILTSSSCEKMLKICPNCQKKIMIYVDYKFVCQNCGYTITSYLIENSYYSVKDEGTNGAGSGKKESIINATQIDYKKMSHYNKILLIIQGKNTSTEIVNYYTEVLKKIVINYGTAHDFKKIVPSEIRAILKELNLSKGYEYVSQIHMMITGIPIPQLNAIKEGKFKDMLQKFIYYYVFVKPSKKKNSFISHYVFRKIFELLNYTEFIPYLSEIESKKLTELDITWKLICERAGWKFISSL